MQYPNLKKKRFGFVIYTERMVVQCALTAPSALPRTIEAVRAHSNTICNNKLRTGKLRTGYHTFQSSYCRKKQEIYVFAEMKIYF